MAKSTANSSRPYLREECFFSNVASLHLLEFTQAFFRSCGSPAVPPFAGKCVNIGYQSTKADYVPAHDRFRSTLAVAAVGYVVKLYFDQTSTRRTAQILAAEHDAAQLQRRNNALLDVYGDRSSLEELEKAVEFYEKK